MRILSIGEIVWDVIEGEERLGGAALNFGAHARRLGHDVHMVSAVGTDPRGQSALRQTAALGISTSLVRVLPNLATGVVKVELNAAGEPQFLIERPAAYDLVNLSDDELAGVSQRGFSWLYFGTLLQTSDGARRLVQRLIESNPQAIPFYDVNLRPKNFTAPLVLDLMARARAVKFSDSEVAAVEEMSGHHYPDLRDFCFAYAERYDWSAVCVTRGRAGCACLVHGEYAAAPGYPVRVVDTVGAGDAFSAAFVHGVANKWPVYRIADFSNRVGALVASRVGAMPEWRVEECDLLENPKSPVQG